MRDSVSAAFFDEMAKTALRAPSAGARSAARVLGARVVGAGLRAGSFAKQKATQAVNAVKPSLASGKRLLIGAGVLAAGTYGLGRGLQAGLSDREKAEKEEANRAARQGGQRPPYAV